MKRNKIVNNTVALYVMTIAKMVLPLVTLPYLTRILTKNCYGMVTFVKAIMQYIQLIIDFGFILSGTKSIVSLKNNSKRISEEVSKVFWAQQMLALLAGIVLAILICFMPMLRTNALFTLLSYIPIYMTCFLFEFYFRGIEQMHITTARFVVMKLVSTTFTFVFVKSDASVLWIPILDILGTIMAVTMIMLELKKRDIKICFVKLSESLATIVQSSIYFASQAATTAFGALNTLMIGIFLSESKVAEWGICMQIVTAVQSMYTPITNGIYPEMVKTRNAAIISKVMKIFMPLVICGCVMMFFVSETSLLIVGGSEYVNAANLLRCFIPVLLFSFPSMLYGWPVLGAIDKQKQVSISTVITALFQIFGLVVLMLVDNFNVISVALLRGVTEAILFCIRYWCYHKNKSEFVFEK